MSLFRRDPGHFTRWLFENGFLPDAGSTDALGRHYVSRNVFGAYVEDELQRALGQSRCGATLRRHRSKAVALRPELEGWRAELADGSSLPVEKVALCTGHSPGAPCPISAAALQQPGLIVNPWEAGALTKIGANDRVLIVGVGLTMADVVATLEQNGRHGPVTAVSRRALLPRQHGLFVDGVDVLAGSAPPKTALELLRLVRRRIREAAGLMGWQPIVDALRARLPEIWAALPPKERLRAVRWLLPYWEVHRFRLSPQAHDALARRLARKLLTIERASVVSIDWREQRLSAELRTPGSAPIQRFYDTIVLCSGPSRNLRANPLLADLLDNGLARMDGVGLGLDVDPFSRILDARGEPQTGLLAIGPMTRGCFGEMTGAPDIAGHIERIVGEIVSSQRTDADRVRRRQSA
jgi:uncharacterized NAD(P)/FAD-binding protein YdhS